MKQNLFLMLLLGMVYGASAQIVTTQVGNTTYDLQTNSSSARRIVVLPNGQKVITYTKSEDGTVDALDRGTGYNFFDGTAWQTTVFPYPTSFTRPESQRVGWPNPIITDNNHEWDFTHAVDASGSYGIHSLDRTPTGTGSWNNAQVTNGLETWPRAVNCGDSIFIIYSASSGGTTNTAYQNGILGGLLMSRSYDGGQTWSQDSIPGIGPGYYQAIGGDEYAIDIQGKKIAIVTGENDVTLYKSNDFGTTWTQTHIIAANNFDSSTITPANRSDGSYSVAFDNSGVVHVMYGERYSYYDGTQSPPGVYYSLINNGIMYWNEHMVGQAPVLIPQSVLTNELHHGRFPVPFYNLSTNNNANTYDGYNVNLVSLPSMAVAPNGVIYASYCKLRPDNDTTNPTNRDFYSYNMDDVYLLKSYDNGATWVGPYNVSNTDTLESYFGCIAKNIDGSVHVLYQQNPYYGNAVGTNTVTAFNGNKNFRDNQILYAQVDTGAVVTPVDYTAPVLNYNSTHIYDSVLINNTINAYVGCPFTLTKQDLLNNYVTVFDNSVGVDTNLLQIYTNVNVNVPGTYFYDIIAVDASGNQSGVMALADANGNLQSFASFDTVSYVVQVLTTDVTPPTLTLLGSDTTYLYYNTSYADSGVIATDDDQCTLAQLVKTYSSTVDSSTPGTYHVTWTATDAAGNTASVVRTVIVGREPQANFVISRIGNAIFRLTDSSLYSPTSWLWTISPLHRTSTQRNPTEQFTQDTTITVCLSPKNQYNAAPYNKPVDSVCKTYFIDVWGNGILETTLSNSIHVYPNPSSGMMTLSLTDNLLEGGTVYVYDLLGNLATAPISIKANTSDTPLNLSSLEAGVYLVKVQSAQGTGVRKISITK